MNDLQIITLLIFGVGVVAHIMLKKMKKEKEEYEPKAPNYKNISQMAQNLSACKASTRLTVLKELQEEGKWTDEEITELVGVLNGMLRENIVLTDTKTENKPAGGISIRQPKPRKDT